MTGDRTLVLAAMIVDADAACAAPGAILLEDGAILAAGPPASIGEPAGVRRIERPRAVVLPGLVNAHCHLDLSHLAPSPYPGDFVRWIAEIRERRLTGEAEIAAAVRRGVELARAGGTVLVGDIAGAGSAVPIRVLREEGVAGVGYLEVFGAGSGQAAAIRRLEAAVETIATDEGGLRLGLSPHAPYSCGLDVYRAAVRLGRPIATHLAETPEEIELARHGTGPLADFLRGLGIEAGPGAGSHPIDALAEVLAAAPVLAAHLNYVEPRHLERLAVWGVAVAYCPRASAYFGHPRAGAAPHRYREMIAAGIDVALGTDGRPCLEAPGGAARERISILDEMRFLHRRDGTDSRTLLAMATTAGARALGFDPALVSLRPGPTAGLIAVDAGAGPDGEALTRVLASDGPPEWILGPVRLGAAGAPAR